MENKIVSRSPGRRKVYTKEERRQQTTAYLLNKEWFCDICNNGKNYKLNNKSNHLRTNKHIVKEFEMKNPGLRMVFPRSKRTKEKPRFEDE